MKKQIARLFLLFAVFCFAGSVYGQTVQNIKEEKIKVTFHCPQGKTFVENGLKKSAGVIEAVADIETKIVAVKVCGRYNKQKRTGQSYRKHRLYY